MTENSNTVTSGREHSGTHDRYMHEAQRQRNTHRHGLTSHGTGAMICVHTDKNVLLSVPASDRLQGVG